MKYYIAKSNIESNLNEPASVRPDIIAVPACVPQTNLFPGECLIIFSQKIDPLQILHLDLLTLHVPRLVSANGTYGKYYDRFDDIFLGLYSGNFEGLTKPSGLPAFYIGMTGNGIVTSFPYQINDFSGPDHYSLLLVNNTKNMTLDAVVTGSFRIYLSE